MKQLALLVLFVVIPLVAQDALKKIEKSPYARKEGVYDRYPLTSNILPNLIGPYVIFGGQNKLNPTDKQEIIFEEQFAKMVKLRNKIVPKLQKLQNLLVKKVVDEGANVQDVQGLLDQIAEKKMLLSIAKIENIHLLKKTWTKEQYQIILDIERKISKDNPE